MKPKIVKWCGFWMCSCPVATGIASSPCLAYVAWCQWRCVKKGKG